MKSGQSSFKTQVIHRTGYDVIVSRKRVKNINLRIRSDGSVAVSAPTRVPLSDIERFIESKDSWIRVRLARIRERNETQRAVQGSTVSVWGEPKSIRIVTEPDLLQASVNLEGDEVIVRMQADQDPDRAAVRLNAALRAWQAQELSCAITTMLPDCERRVGKSCGNIRIKQMKTRWGSCNTRTGALSINLELAERPPQCLEQVLIHELCHLWEANHSPRFYAHMDRAMPNWREARALLKDQPPRGRQSS